ncbi:MULTISPECIES: hypothetical protein [unclassified Burkholderia]|uniref:hypothetical protein n=1 Tax=unclassified Burkholderia TaxID=2613784 RepID=UPI000F586F06|nr:MULTISPECIES: hypothetical protein [unclassified Burkholderia]
MARTTIGAGRALSGVFGGFPVGSRLASACVKLPRDNLSHSRFCNDDLPHPSVFHRARATYDSATFVDRMRIGHTQRIQ